MKHVTRLALAGLLLAVGCATTSTEPVIDPSLNANFQNPDVQTYINMFEGDGRAIYANRDAIVDTLNIQPGEDVADVGAGTGFFSRMFAKKTDGTVYAVDIAENFLRHIEETAKAENIGNIVTVHCDQYSTKLPANSVDVVFICDTYHHFEHPERTMASIHEALRPGGRLVVVDFERVRGVTTPFSLEHVRAGKGTFTDEIKDAGFDYVDEVDLMEDQYVLRFRKREAAAE